MEFKIFQNWFIPQTFKVFKVLTVEYFMVFKIQYMKKK